MVSIMNLHKKLFSIQDKNYKDFVSKLTPGYPAEKIIGIKTPALKALAKEMIAENTFTDFLDILPHAYFEENQLHSFIISGLKNYDDVIYETNKFLPYIDNWATCDQLCPVIFRKNTDKLESYIERWLSSSHTYTIRFGIKMIMNHYLDKNFKKEYMYRVASVRSDEYYVNMMIAWYFATALAKQYDTAITFIENKALDTWVHNKAIQKATESYRVDDEHKKYLKTLKINNRRNEK